MRYQFTNKFKNKKRLKSNTKSNSKSISKKSKSNSRRRRYKNSKQKITNSIADNKICNQNISNFRSLLSPENLYWEECKNEIDCDRYVKCIKNYIPVPLLFRQLLTSPFAKLPVKYIQEADYDIYIFDEHKGSINKEYLNKLDNIISEEKNGSDFVNWFFSDLSVWTQTDIVLFITRQNNDRIIGYIKAERDRNRIYNFEYVAVDKAFENYGLCKRMINVLCNFLYYVKHVTQIKIYPINFPAYKCYMKTIGQYYPFFISEDMAETFNKNYNTNKSPIQLANKNDNKINKYSDYKFRYWFYSIHHNSNIN